MDLNPDALLSAVCSDVRQVSPQAEFQPGVTCEHTTLSYRCEYLIHSLVRKYQPEDSTALDEKAWGIFTEANNRCRDHNIQPLCWADEMLIEETRRILDDFFHPGGNLLVQSVFDILMNGRSGPGVVVLGKGTSLYEKYYSSELSTSSDYLYEEYRRYAEWIPFLSDAELHRYEKFGKASVVDGSKVCFVPKTSAVSRMICIEPSVNMYWQLGLAQILEERLKSFFSLDLARQPQINRRLARRGSWNGSLCTIDLTSASDSISLRLCELLLPKWFFELLLLLRSRKTTSRFGTVGLYMISTMGNGFTFPLQTILFAAITRACYAVSGKQARKGNWAVFGDDIIVETSLFHRVTRFLRLLGFTVNEGKTFSEGVFRESCGADWFKGEPVRPVFIKTLKTPYDRLVALNQLLEWSSISLVPLKRACRLLLLSIPKKFRLLVPFESGLDTGIRVPSTMIRTRKRDGNLSIVYRSWAPKPTSIRIMDGKILLPRSVKELWFNPSGLYCSFFFGELVQMSISVRQKGRLMYRTRLNVTHRWDYVPFGYRTLGTSISWSPWETMVVEALTDLI